MLYFFVRSKSRPGEQPPDAVLSILSTFSEVVMESGVLFLIMAALELGLCAGFQGMTYLYAPGLALSKLYSNSMFAVRL